jgi:hypothetical protein
MRGNYQRRELTMNKIPTASQVSLSKGLWFIFTNGGRGISAQCSVLTGKERIFVDGSLVSEKWSFGKTSTHQFTVEGDTYEVVFFIPHILSGNIECTLNKNGVRVECFRTSYRYRHRVATLLAYGLIGALLGFLVGYFNLPVWPILIAVILLIAIAAAREAQKVSIDRMET